ncbi:cysteine desulfurase [Candidatus Woesearchaeota archaeon]|nr:MAG: cysteine desulfurase [Candidatus Woesearchaeota archaeon]
MAVVQKLNAVQVQKDFPFFRQGLIYLDSAATSQKPRAVLNAVVGFYESNNANVNRGMYQLAEKATAKYDEARRIIAGFIGARDDELIFVRNATEAINMVAQCFARNVVGAGDSVLVTEMEHHSNILPWQRVAREKGGRLDVVPITERGVIEISALREKLAMRPKLFAFSHVSNVLGTVNPAKEFIAEAHKLKIPVLLDASQSIPSMPIDVKGLDCDFLVFSGHKMLGPHIGVLYVKREFLERMSPFLVGGGMVKEVTFESATFKDGQEKFDAGTFDVPGAVGLAAAIDYLKKIGMENVQAHEEELARYAYDVLAKDPAITVYGPRDRLNLVSFNVGDMHAHDVAAILDEAGICVRAGHHCAQPLMRRLGIPACVRASFGVYNTKEDVDALIAAIGKAKKVFGI